MNIINSNNNENIYYSGFTLTNDTVDDNFEDLDEAEAKPLRGKVLIAEDIKTNRLVLCSLLDTLQLEAIQASDGKEAVTLFKADPRINFILMDVKMPVMDGIEATAIIREWEEIRKLERTPIIAVTAFDYAEDIKRCTDAGMDDIMYKPADLKTLSKVVDKFLSVKKMELAPISAKSHEETLKKILENREEPVFSEDWLKTFVKDHKKLASVILHSAMNGMPNFFNLLRESLESSNWEECRAVVHVLRGVLRQMGAVRLHSIFVELNTHLKNGGELNEGAFQKVSDEYQTLEQQLQEWLRNNV